jgi:hypothetical protein
MSHTVQPPELLQGKSDLPGIPGSGMENRALRRRH